MKTKQLTSILQDASMFLSKQTTIPVIGMFYFGKTIKATDMEKYFEYDFDTWVDLCVPSTILDILKNLDWDEVTLIQDKNTLHIECAWDKFTLTWVSTSEYVAFPKVKWTTTTIDSVDMMKWFTNVLPAIQEKNFSPVMTWIKISRKNWELVFAWTDSFRLHEVKLKNDWDDFWIVIPKIHATTISKVVSKMNVISMTASSNMVQLKWDWYTVTSLLIQWNYPDYNNENIMPTQFNYVIKVDAFSLAKAVKKITILTKEINNFVELECKDDKLLLRSKNSTKGSSEVSIDCKWNNVTFWLNGSYLDILSTFTWECELKIVSPEKPVTVKDYSRDYFTCIIRPLVK